jgi:hypothetical protein
MNNRYSNADPSSNARSYKKKYLGNFLGIVVQNNDPDKQGRIKVFVPHISPSVYKNWIDSTTDISFKFLGKNINSSLSNIINQLREILPWADCAAPLVGASGSGRYNAFSDTASISDSNKFTTTQPTSVLSKYNLNKDGIGEKPARKYEIQPLQIADAFCSSLSASSNRINKYSNSYLPSSYSNCAKGTFSIPNVGSHVWIFFREGDPMFPVYFAVSFGDTDWKSIFDITADEGIDYPGASENKTVTDMSSYNHNSETYRNKFVFSQKGGIFEIVNTDNRELLKLTHYSGSFLEFNNQTTIQLATANDQKLVLADQFLTTKGFRSEFVGRDFEQIIRGDFYKKIGNLNRDAFTQWKTIVDQIAELKQLFEIKRAAYFQDSIYIKKVSQGQQKKPAGIGGHNSCPVCSNPNRENIWNTNSVLSELPSGLLSSIFTGINTPSLFLGVVPRFRGNTPQLIQPAASPSNFLNGGNCPCCGGSGISPSSQGGTFDNQDKDTLISGALTDKISQLAEIEKQLGLGGSEIIQITKHKIENIGLLMNDFPSIRIDEIGKINKSEVVVLPKGVITNQKASPLIELVHVDDLPGGSYNLNVCNRFNVLVGAGGVSIKSYGVVELGGTIINIAGEQVNIASENEVNIVGDKRLTLTSESIVLRHKNYGQVLVDGNFGVTQNVVIGGSLHVEGELTIQHITAPVEVQETETTKLRGWVTPEEIHIKLRTVDDHRVIAIAPVKVEFIPHSHEFVNLPLTLTKTADGTRKVGQNTSKLTRMPAFPVVNSKKVAIDP